MTAQLSPGAGTIRAMSVDAMARSRAALADIAAQLTETRARLGKLEAMRREAIGTLDGFESIIADLDDGSPRRRRPGSGTRRAFPPPDVADTHE